MENIRKPLIGFRDIVGDEKRVTEFIKWKTAELFQQWGYDILEVPIVEKTTSFSEEIVGHSPWPEWDKKGCFYISINEYSSYGEEPAVRDALLIPEGTVSVARWIADEIMEKGEDILPRKIFYVTPCFRNELISKLTSTKCRQFDQVGVEILGSHSKGADVESILLITKGLENIGFDPDRIVVRLSDVEIFNKLCDICNLGPEDKVNMKELLDAIAENRAYKDEAEIIRLKEEFRHYLVSLNLEAEKFDHWMHFTEKDGFKALPEALTQPTLTYLEDISSDLTNKYGLKVQIDCSVVRSHEYYTGTVFEVDYIADDRVYVEIAGGGRYNKLIGKFTNGNISIVPSTGFAYGIQRLVSIWKDLNLNRETQNISFYLEQNAEDVLILSKSNDYYKAFVEAEMYRKKGKRANIYVEAYERCAENCRYVNVKEVD